MAVFGVHDVVADAPGGRGRGQIGERSAGAACPTLPRPPSSRSGNSDSWRTSDRPEKPTPTRRIGPMSTGSSSSRRAMAIRVAASVVAYGSVAERVRMLMSDFFSLTVTVRAPRPSFSRRAWACSPIGPAASRSWSRVVRSSGKVDSALICLARGVLRDRAGRRCRGPAGAAPGPTVAPEDVGGFGVGQRGEGADGFDAEPVQLLLGDRADAPQPPHRKPVRAARVPRRGAPRGCRRAWPGPRRSWRSACPIRRRRRRPARSRARTLARRSLAERLDVARPTPRRAREVRRRLRRRTAVRGRARRVRTVSSTRRLATP